MFIRQNKMLLLWIMLVVSSFNGSSSNTVVTYTTKNFEELQCLIDETTASATWNDETTSNELYSYSGLSPDDIESRDLQPKHGNFNYSYVPNTHFNLIINKVEGEDEGTYICAAVGRPSVNTEYYVTVEAIPDEFSLDCFVPPDVTCPAQDVTSISKLICTCEAKGVHPDTLSLNISGTDNVQQDSTTATSNDGLFDLSLTATVPVTDSATEVTCSVSGYNTTEPIPPKLITTTLMISPPTCDLDILFDQDCKGATLSCSCSAIPTEGEPSSGSGMVFSYFNGTGHLISGNATTTVQINDVEAGVDLKYSCRGCNGLYYGNSSYVTASKVCTISTTALPTTTIVTTAPPSTNERTSTKATESATEKSGSTTTKKSGGLTRGAKIGIGVGSTAVGIGILALIAVMMFKKGKCGSNSSSDKLDDNGAGPRGDPEIPAYGVVDKNRTKDPTPAPRSSMRDSKNPSNPKQDGPLELQYAALDHGNKPPSDEVRKPKEEPTEYATVQSVIV